YMALTDEANERAGKPKISIWKHIFRLRTIIYTLLWSGIGIRLVFLLFVRADIDMTVAPVRNPQFVTLSDGSIRNTYDVRIRNMSHDDSDFAISLVADAPLEVTLEGQPGQSVNVALNSTHLQRVYVTAPAGSAAAMAERTDFRLWVEDEATSHRAFRDTTFFGRVPQ
ncbi:MAG: cytochrome c oxidase accessory protein CcoG, partial [Proteobacteria bacterium]|nr:cytochrome c oxidase accessory protein CcoG [Pseudomonadota bacterium]